MIDLGVRGRKRKRGAAVPSASSSCTLLASTLELATSSIIAKVYLVRLGDDIDSGQRADDRGPRHGVPAHEQ
jgi:hypothetical protein